MPFQTWIRSLVAGKPHLIRCPRTTRLGLETLEQREVPATLVNPTTLSYQDKDGDVVKVVFSKPILTANNVNAIFSFDLGNVGGSNTAKQQLRSINLSGVPAAVGTNLTLTSTHSATNGGDGFAAVGEIDATNLDLGKVFIDGDLGRILAGSGASANSGLAGLTVQSMGLYGTSTGAPDLHTTVRGKLASLHVQSDVKHAFIDNKFMVNDHLDSVFIGGSLIGGPNDHDGSIRSGGNIGSVTIKGDVVGGDGSFTGEIEASGKLGPVTIGCSLLGSTGLFSGSVFSNLDMGTVKITGSVVGGDGQSSGRIASGGKLAGLTIGGSLLGGTNYHSGSVFSNLDMGTVKITGSVVGGDDQNTGRIASGGKLTGLTIGGSLLGGTGDRSGSVNSDFDMGAVKINGDIIGGSASGNVDLQESGYVHARRIGKLTVGGSVVAGTDNTSGQFLNNGAIRVENDLGMVNIKGSLIGNSTNPVIISARRSANPTTTSDVTIASLTIGGHVEFAKILAGVDPLGNNVNADAQIGAVRVGGNWIASSLAAGVTPGVLGYYGTGFDAKMSGNGVKEVASVTSKIASVTIGGQAMGVVGVFDSFGIVAENVGAVKIGGTTLPLKAGAHNDVLDIGITGDFRVREV